MRHSTTLLLSILMLCSCGGGGHTAAQTTPVVPVEYTYEVVAEYPHLRTSYTQGLQYCDGEMWEGTGGYNRESHLQRLDLASGAADVVATLHKSEFGEGITLLGDKIYQLTWREGKMYIYDRATCKRLTYWSYKGEGWGLTTDGTKLYMSDGTSFIRIIDPKTMKYERSVSVTLQGESLAQLNELEWIDGRIWANVYMTDCIAIINPGCGAVEGIIDLTGLLPEKERDMTTDVLNGIAYDEAAKRIFVTGKNWSKMYEIKIVAR
ncbi:MAG: glutaminyl-peptide cyclotransferase [Alistipes sp.]|nr:glutaminyl-peptide cyclotransferase [Alistipes sp.]